MTRTAEQAIHTLEIAKEQEIAAPIEIVFETLLEHLGPLHETSAESPLPMKLEPWPGGRWYRDLGNNTGHFWGHVQVIKPPTLLEVWITDVLPNELAAPIGALMEQGAADMKQTLEREARPATHLESSRS